MGLYRLLHWAGFALSAAGAGLFSILRGLKLRRLDRLPGHRGRRGRPGLHGHAAIDPSALPESDAAVTTCTYLFVRSLCLVWGATMAAIAFNGQVGAHLDAVADPEARQLLVNGGAYTYAGGLGELPDPARGQVIEAYELALRTAWLVFVSVACLGFLVAFAEKHLKLRNDHSAEFGLAKKPPAGERAEKGGEASSPDAKTSEEAN
ncbi:hypothetical protein DL767_000933 [Monosporascus sp. MG133]|nr:hypothetical protein DL767_000933 [Monosporascus sp. MG133]